MQPAKTVCGQEPGTENRHVIIQSPHQFTWGPLILYNVFLHLLTHISRWSKEVPDRHSVHLALFIAPGRRRGNPHSGLSLALTAHDGHLQLEEQTQ